MTIDELFSAIATAQAVADVVANTINRYIEKEDVNPDDIVAGLGLAMLRSLALFPDKEIAKRVITSSALGLMSMSDEACKYQAINGKLWTTDNDSSCQ